MGTPPQKVTLIIDTGSSDFWINEASTSYCSNPEAQPLCRQYGTYNSGSSTSRVPVENSFFQVNYIDGTGAAGGFVKDTITFGGQELTEFQFGEVYSSGTPLGVIGLGYEANEQGAPAYPTLPEALVNKGLINLNAYSIWLNNLAASSGTILFGGVDKAKYAGKLTTLAIEQGPNSPQLGVSLNSVSFKDAKAVKPFTPLVDTGAEYSYLPSEMTDIILTPLGAVYRDWFAFVECSLATSASTVDFELGADQSLVTIRVPLSSLVYRSKSIQSPPKNARGVDLCAIGIANLESNEDEGALGDSFLRSAYVVVDLAHSQISFAQAVFTSATNIVEIPANGVAAINT